MKKWLALLCASILFSACSAKEENTPQEKTEQTADVTEIREGDSLIEVYGIREELPVQIVLCRQHGFSEDKTIEDKETIQTLVEALRPIVVKEISNTAMTDMDDTVDLIYADGEKIHMRFMNENMETNDRGENRLLENDEEFWALYTEIMDAEE